MVEIKLEIKNLEEIREAWAGMSEAEKSAVVSAALRKTAQDIKTEMDKTATNHEL